jgi:hypothetical protein
MISVVERHVTSCPQCAGPLAYRLGVNEGGGFRYDVTCVPCGEIVYEFSAPQVELRAAA